MKPIERMLIGVCLFAATVHTIACGDNSTVNENKMDALGPDTAPSDVASEKGKDALADVLVNQTDAPQAMDTAVDRTADSPRADAAQDSGADALFDGGVACGTTRCGSGQLCLNPCSKCGAAPICEPRPDGGICSLGTVACLMLNSGTPGCARDCSPPPRRCIDIPQACGNLPTCACIKTGEGPCLFISDGQVTTACPP